MGNGCKVGGFFVIMGEMKRVIRRFFPGRVQSLLRKVYYRFPLIRKVYYFPSDLCRLITGKRERLMPPKSKVFVGDGDFEQVSEEFFNYFIKYINLKPNEKVLEVGSGIGRMAIPLTQYLNKDGRYEGLEIVKEGVAWCCKNIAREFKNFNFHLIDVYNNLYNVKGKYKASEYKFPFKDNTFDFIFLTSVFTHMVIKDIKNYLSEISRTLKRNGKVLITFFLLNQESLKYIDSGKSKFNFRFENSRVIDANIPEASIAHDETVIRELFKDNKIQIREPILYGSWCKREHYTSYQDIIIGIKAGVRT